MELSLRRSEEWVSGRKETRCGIWGCLELAMIIQSVFSLDCGCSSDSAVPGRRETSTREGSGDLARVTLLVAPRFPVGPVVRCTL